MNVLWLTSWYPGRVDMLAGDFIERHAQASALMNNTYVIHVVKDTTGQIKKVTREERLYNEKLTAVIYYYPRSGAILSNIYFLWLHRRAWKEYKKKYGKPAGILVQVGIKAGIIAWLRQKFTGIPYILFERWTGFLDVARPNFNQKPALLRSLWVKVLRNARELVTASKYFGEYFKQHYDAISYSVIPNFINDQLFYYRAKTNSQRFEFIHISTLEYQKNFELLQKAFTLLTQKDSDNVLTVYGPIPKEHNASQNIIFKGEVTHDHIAAALQKADVLVLCSRYETFGNVVMEANACGLPVIVSDLPVFHEIVKEGKNGTFVDSNDAEALAEKMLWMKKNILQFNNEKIAAAAMERFSKEKIAAQFDALYKKHFS